jgi:hypothetical protein
MSATVIAANGMAGVGKCEQTPVETRCPDVRPEVHTDSAAQIIRGQNRIGDWSPEKFAGEQIRGLVRQIFFATPPRPVRQVIFSAIEGNTDVRAICRRVGEALTLETAEGVAVVGSYPKIVGEMNDLQLPTPGDGASALRRGAARLRSNLWLVPTETSSGAGVSTALRVELGRGDGSIGGWNRPGSLGASHAAAGGTQDERNYRSGTCSHTRNCV